MSSPSPDFTKTSERSLRNLCYTVNFDLTVGARTWRVTRQGVLFSNLFRRPVTAVYSPQSSSDGGSLLLKACDAALGLTETLAARRVGPRSSCLLRSPAATRMATMPRAPEGSGAVGGSGSGPGTGLLRSHPVALRESIRRDLLEAAKGFAAAVIERQGGGERESSRS